MKTTVYLLLMHWSYEGDSGVDYFIYSDWHKAFEQFNDTIQEEIQNQWVGNHIENGEAEEGYRLETHYSDVPTQDSWWYFKELQSENFTLIDLKTIEVI